MHKFLTLIIVIAISIILQKSADAGIDVFDDITPANKSIMLRAITKGRFFPEGGKLVHFYVNEKKRGTTLSGGDGYALLKYTPVKPGLKKIKALSNGDSSEARLLVTAKKDPIILIATEVFLLDSILIPESDRDASAALSILSKNFNIIYLSSMIGLGQTKKWLEEREFPPSIVIPWEGTVLIDTLKERGINIYAIVGTPEILAEAQDINRRFSFKASEKGETIDTWEELGNKLK